MNGVDLQVGDLVYVSVTPYKVLGVEGLGRNAKVRLIEKDAPWHWPLTDNKYRRTLPAKALRMRPAAPNQPPATARAARSQETGRALRDELELAVANRRGPSGPFGGVTVTVDTHVVRVTLSMQAATALLAELRDLNDRAEVRHDSR